MNETLIFDAIFMNMTENSSVVTNDIFGSFTWPEIAAGTHFYVRHGSTHIPLFLTGGESSWSLFPSLVSSLSGGKTWTLSVSLVLQNSTLLNPVGKTITYRVVNQCLRGSFSPWCKTDPTEHKPNISKSKAYLIATKLFQRLLSRANEVPSLYVGAF